MLPKNVKTLFLALVITIEAVNGQGRPTDCYLNCAISGCVANLECQCISDFNEIESCINALCTVTDQSAAALSATSALLSCKIPTSNWLIKGPYQTLSTSTFATVIETTGTGSTNAIGPSAPAPIPTSINQLSTTSGLASTGKPTVSTSTLSTTALLSGISSNVFLISTSLTITGSPRSIPSHQSSSGLSTGEIGGLVGGALGFVLLIFITVIFFLLRLRKYYLERTDANHGSMVESNIENLVIAPQLEGRRSRVHDIHLGGRLCYTYDGDAVGGRLRCTDDGDVVGGRLRYTDDGDVVGGRLGTEV